MAITLQDSKSQQFSTSNSGQNRAEQYTNVEKSDSAVTGNRDSALQERRGRKRKNYYTRLLELLARQTTSDKRREIFGADPLRQSSY
jgi:hypothetical protein